MKIILTILFFGFTACFAQSKCIEPIVTGNFAPIVTLPNNTYTFGMNGAGQNGSPSVSYSYSITSGSGTLQNASSQTASIANLAQGMTIVRLIVSDSCHVKDTSNIIITVNPSITPPNWVLNLYPNPAFTSFTASLSGPGSGFTRFYFENNFGTRLIEETTTKTSTITAASVLFNNISRYRNGTYVVQAIVGNVTTTAKLVIKR